MFNFKKLMDTPECDILFEQYPDAFILMTIIAKKARQNDNLALMGLSKGQAFITDYKKFGLTESRYRKAKKQLEKFGFASFRPTNRGTIATILDSRIYDINDGTDSEQKTTDMERIENDLKTFSERKQNRERTVDNIENNKEMINKNFENSIKPHCNPEISKDTVPEAEYQNKPDLKPTPDYIIVRKKIRDSAPELNEMFVKKVIEPLKRNINPSFWEKFINPLVIKSIDEGENIAYLYHGKDNSWVNNHFRDKIEEKLGMAVKFVD